MSSSSFVSVEWTEDYVMGEALSILYILFLL